MTKKIKHYLGNVYRFFLQGVYLLPGAPNKQKNNDVIIPPPKNAELLDVIITPTYENKKGILTIISDDGDYQTGKKLKQFSEKYMIPITVAGSVFSIQRQRSFWKHVVKHHMFEVVNHSYNHARMAEEEKWISKDKKRLTHELVHSGVFFEKIFNTKSFTFVCPFNQMCSMGYEIMSENGIYAVARGTRGLNELSPRFGYEPGELMNLKRNGVMDVFDGNAEDHRRELVESAIENNKWLIEMWHNVSEDMSKGYQTILPEEAEVHLKYISERKDELWVALFTDAVKYIYERQNAEVKAYISDGYLNIVVELNNLPLFIFDQELTVKVDCSSIAFDRYQLDYTYEDGKRYIQTDVAPGRTRQILLPS